MEFYTAKTIDKLDLTTKKTEESFLTYLTKDGLNNYIGNIKADIALLRLNQQLLPILIPNHKAKNAYVCSPHTHYVTVGLESLNTIKNTPLRLSAAIGLRLLGLVLKSTSVNNTLYVNHWLLSTDLHPENLTLTQLDFLTKTLAKHYPDRAIIFRSLNSWTNSKLMRNLDHLGYQLIASRHTYLSSIDDKNLFNNRIIKNDLKLWEESACEVISHENFTNDETIRASELCHILAIDHHSQYNPAIHTSFLNLLKNHPAIKVLGLKKNGLLIGIIGYQINHDNILTCTLFGYDKNHPEQNTHYRLLSTLLLLEAKKYAKIFNQSAGGSYFKKSRGAHGYTEYQSVYTKHLSKRQNAGWTILRNVINKFAPDLMREY